MLPGETAMAVSIARVRKALEQGMRLDGQPLPKTFDRDAFERTLDNTPQEHFTYQTIQSQAHAMGKITTAEAQVIYIALGEVPAADGWAEGTDLATKVIVTQALGELIRRAL